MGTPVSGPGQFSQRTDKAVSNANSSLPNAQYGENKDYQEVKSGAPTASGGGAPPMDIGALMGSMAPDAIGLGEPSQNPDQPVTAGADMGEGPGSEVLGAPPVDPSASRNDSYIIALEWMASQPNSSDASRNLLRQIKANMVT